jgi:Mg2+ and Co2+ transporter CorA
MINLIPPVAKKRVVTEYWARTISLWAFLGGTALLLMATLFVPLNIYVINQETYLATILANNESVQNNHEDNVALLVRANQQAALLLQTKREYTTHEILPLLAELAGEMIELEEVTINQTKDPVLFVNGIAETRQSLVEFRDELEKYEDFLTVVLPIGNLIKDSEAPFSITITLATSTISS